jgi:hypothetical protein
MTQNYLVNKTKTTLVIRNGYVNILPLGYIAVSEEETKSTEIAQLAYNNFAELVITKPTTKEFIQPEVEVTEHKAFTGYSYSELQAELVKDEAKKVEEAKSSENKVESTPEPKAAKVSKAKA